MCRPDWRRALVQAQRLSEFTRLRRVRDRIDREHARPLDVEALARDAGVSVAHLGRWFRLAYGRSPHAYLTARRTERAEALLRHNGNGAGMGRDRGMVDI
ncbi:helix-turn-helix domain-containing protein [Streptomyces pini]|uniref:Helix-turn-helix domain-containing protein n=1 Tax=Streptomyces pini TaxID=1520580 RepID=A0A1I4INQ5_9ACTN|nr:Helix-turn-helix domain-containing protein [Streptomyces pini]